MLDHVDDRQLVGRQAVARRPCRSSSLHHPPSDEAFCDREVETWKVIGSPGFPFDEAEVRRRAAASFDRSFYPEGVARQLAAIMASPDRTPALGSVRVPALVIHGEDDALIDVSGGSRHRRRHPRIRAVGHSGHGPQPAAGGVGTGGGRHHRQHRPGDHGRLTGRSRPSRVTGRSRPGWRQSGPTLSGVESAGPKDGLQGDDRAAATRRRNQLADRYLVPRGERPASSARGVHHVALLVAGCRAHHQLLPRHPRVPLDRDLREPRITAARLTSSLTSATATRWPSSTYPGSTSPATRRCSAACTIWPSRSNPSAGNACGTNLEAAGVECQHVDGSSLYFRDPDAARLELISDPLGEMYGSPVV